MFQAIASWILSVILEVVLADPLNHTSLHDTRSVRKSLFSVAFLHDEVERLQQDFGHLIGENANHLRQLSIILGTLRKDRKTHLEHLTKTKRSPKVPQTLVEENIHEYSPRQEARKAVAEILYFSSDAQTLAGQCSFDQLDSALY
jgi:hypothetical protein